MGSINFFFVDIPSIDDLNDKLIHFLDQIITIEKFSTGSLNFIFCSDDYLYEINAQYLEHFYYTDVITFDLSESPLTISGDIFISIDRVSDNALTLNIPFQSELIRVLIHGILHLCGYDDRTPDLKVIMQHKENYYLSKFVH